MLVSGNKEYNTKTRQQKQELIKEWKRGNCTVKGTMKKSKTGIRNPESEIWNRITGIQIRNRKSGIEDPESGNINHKLTDRFDTAE